MLVLILFGTAPAVEEAPHYTYVYKHIGVTRYIESHGSVNPSIDIYHRWPGFFAFGAWFSELIGVADPTHYVAWVEPGLMLLSTLLVVSLALAVTRSRQLSWTAGLVFVASNWIGQTYYSPQGFDFILLLGVSIACWCLRPPEEPNRLGRLAERLTARLVRGKPEIVAQAAPASPSVSGCGVLLVLVLVLDSVAVVSHQLTPYAILAITVSLAVFGYLRPIWLPAALVVITAAYLVPNYSYIEHNFGVLGSLDPFSNAKTSVPAAHEVPARLIEARMSLLLILLVWALAFAGLVIRARAGHVRQVVRLALCTWSPALILIGQSYGGEAGLRVYLYSLPFASIGVAWLLHSMRFRASAGRASITFVACSIFIALLLGPYLGREDLAAVPAAEVQASNWLYANGTPGSVVMLSVPNFPTRYGANYDKFVGPNGEDTPNLLLGTAFADKTFDPATTDDITDVISVIRQYSKQGYLLFSTSQERFARSYGVFGGDGVERLESAVKDDPRFKLAYSNQDTRIYQLVSRGA